MWNRFGFGAVISSVLGVVGGVDSLVKHVLMHLFFGEAKWRTTLVTDKRRKGKKRGEGEEERSEAKSGATIAGEPVIEFHFAKQIRSVQAQCMYEQRAASAERLQ